MKAAVQLATTQQCRCRSAADCMCYAWHCDDQGCSWKGSTRKCNCGAQRQSFQTICQCWRLHIHCKLSRGAYSSGEGCLLTQTYKEHVARVLLLSAHATEKPSRHYRLVMVESWLPRRRNRYFTSLNYPLKLHLLAQNTACTIAAQTHTQPGEYDVPTHVTPAMYVST